MPNGTGGNDPDAERGRARGRGKVLSKGIDVLLGLSRLLTREVRVRYRAPREIASDSSGHRGTKETAREKEREREDGETREEGRRRRWRRTRTKAKEQ